MTVDFLIPKACSLVQAAFWVTRRQPPISDFTFEAAPLMLGSSEIDPQGPLRLLLLRLRNGDLPAWGDLTLFAGEFGGESTSWTARPIVYRIKIPEAFWLWPNVQWQVSEISGIDLLNPEFRYFTPEYDTEKFLKLQEASEAIKSSGMQQKLIISSITVDTQKLLSLLPSISDPEQVPCISDAAPSPLQPQNYIPPYVEFMLLASRELNLHSDNRMPKDVIEAWIKQHWPDSLGKPSRAKSQYMATFLRDPSDEKGGYHHPQRSR